MPNRNTKKHMKGFMHIVEIVVMCILLFFVFFQLSETPVMQTDWSTALLTLQGNDLLFSLDQKGIDWLSTESVETEISALIPENLMFEVLAIDEIGDIHYIRPNYALHETVTVSLYKIIEGNIYEIILNLGYTY